MGWHYYNFDSLRNKLHPLKSSTFSKEKNISAHLQEQKKGLLSQYSIPFYVESKIKWHKRTCLQSVTDSGELAYGCQEEGQKEKDS